MAQWGAYGYAQQGYSYDAILAHYYKGTTIGQASVTKVRVFLAQGQSRLTVSSLSPFTVRDGIGQLWHLAAGPQTFGPGLRVKTSDFPQRQQLPGPLTFNAGSSPLRFGDRPYRGQVQVSVANGALRAVNVDHEQPAGADGDADVGVRRARPPHLDLVGVDGGVLDAVLR